MKRAKKSSTAQAVGRSGRTGSTKIKREKTAEARGWGLRVGGGPCPYLWYKFSRVKADILSECTAPYHRPMEVVMIPLREWRRLKRMDRKSNGALHRQPEEGSEK